MEWSRLPPLSSLRAFHAYAECGSLAQAGALLNVSHAAISQQLKALEDHLGLRLLDRNGRKMQLTPEGELLARSLIDGFGGIALTIDALTGADATRPLRVTCTPSFASSWLMPRLQNFRMLHENIDIMIDPSPKLTNPSPGGIDVALRYGTGDWPGLEVEMLLPSSTVIVAAPAFFPDGIPSDLSDLHHLPWLQELGTSEGSAWLARLDVKMPITNVLHVPGNLVLDGLRNGQGLAIIARQAVECDIKAGRLLVLFEEAQDAGYHIVTNPGPYRAPLKAFIRWLRREAAIS